jgi:hypothetical protein
MAKWCFCRSLNAVSGVPWPETFDLSEASLLLFLLSIDSELTQAGTLARQEI